MLHQMSFWVVVVVVVVVALPLVPYGSLIRLPGGWRGGNCPRLLSLYFLRKSDDNKNETFQNAVFPVL